MKVKRVIFTQNVNADLKAKFYEDNGNLHILVSKKGATPFYEEAGVIETEIIGESKPKTRTEYEKVTQENTTPKQLCEMIINGDYFCDSEHCGGSYEYRDVMARYARKSDSLYRKVEKEITWQDEFIDLINSDAKQCARLRDGNVELSVSVKEEKLIDIMRKVVAIADGEA